MNKATLESQLLSASCNVSDTEEMFWLRQNDDLQSKLALGGALVSQYRFREAATVWNTAAGTFRCNPEIYLRIGGALLTVMDLDGSLSAYTEYINRGGAEKQAAFPLGIRHYLKGEYDMAADRFEKVLSCDDEMLISVIYWHSLSRLRSGKDTDFLDRYRPDMKVGHHTAYRQVVEVLAGEKPINAAMASAENEKDDLNYCILAYGLYCIIQKNGYADSALLESILDRKETWPCIAYLAAWNDFQKRGIYGCDRSKI